MLELEMKRDNINLYLLYLRTTGKRFTDIAEFRDLFTYENYSIYVNKFFLPWLAELREKGLLTQGKKKSINYVGEMYKGMACGEGCSDAYAGTHYDDKKEGLGLDRSHKGRLSRGEWKAGEQFGKSTDAWLTGSSDFNAMHNERGLIRRSTKVESDGTFYKLIGNKAVLNKACAENWLEYAGEETKIEDS